MQEVEEGLTSARVQNGVAGGVLGNAPRSLNPSSASYLSYSNPLHLVVT
jgi:hypothetical protein